MKLALLGIVLATIATAKPKLTVLDVKVQSKGVQEEFSATLGELLRAAVGTEVAGRMLLMDKESLYEILKDADIDPSQCSEAECEVDLFRRMQADFGITPVLLSLGEGRLKLLLKLHQASNGEVLKVVELYGTSLGDLDQPLRAKISELLEPLTQRLERGVFGAVEAAVHEEQGGELTFKKVESEVLTFISVPPLADLHIDGKLIGSTGKTGSKQPLPYGRYKVRMELANYLPAEQVLEVRKGMTDKILILNLESSLREVVLASTPEQGAEVFVNGTKVGSTPHRLPLPIGKHEVRLSREQYLPRNDTLVLTRETEQGTQFDFVLTPNYGLLNLTTTPPGIAVYLDEEEVGTTPIEGHRLLLGVHDVALHDPRYFTVTIEKLQLTTPLEVVTKDFTLKQKFGGLDLGSHDEHGSLVVAEVYLNGKKVGETEPRVQQMLPVGSYDLEVRTDHRTFSDTFQIKEHGEMYQKDILLHSLTDEELAAQEAQRRRHEAEEELRRATEEEHAAFARIEAQRAEHNVILYPALLVGFGALAGSAYLFTSGFQDGERANEAHQAYTNAVLQADMDYWLSEAEELRDASRLKLVGGAALGAVAAGSLGLAIYEDMLRPDLPERRYTVVPVIGGGALGVTLWGRW